jgi:ribosomal protein S18 acetylase RimI-like enzyme
MRSLQRNDIPGLEQILHTLQKAGNFTADEVECAMELLNLVLDQPDQKDYIVVVAEKNAGVVGYILYGQVPLTEGNFDIYWIATDPAEHGQGFGRLLLEHAERDMCRRGARMIGLETSSKGNYDRTRLFYDNAGYQVESVIRDFYTPGDDRVTYVKRFTSKEA